MAGRVLGSLIAGIAVFALAGCSTSIAGTAVAATGSASSSGSPSSSAPVTNPTAAQVCGSVPAGVVEQLFHDANVQTAVSSQTNQQGIYQVQCLITGSAALKINLVFASAAPPVTPSIALATIQSELGISGVKPLTGVGTAQQAISYTWQNGSSTLDAVSGAKQVGGATHVFTLFMPVAAKGGAALVKLLGALFT